MATQHAVAAPPALQTTASHNKAKDLGPHASSMARKFNGRAKLGDSITSNTSCGDDDLPRGADEDMFGLTAFRVVKGASSRPTGQSSPLMRGFCSDSEDEDLDEEEERGGKEPQPMRPADDPTFLPVEKGSIFTYKEYRGAAGAACKFNASEACVDTMAVSTPKRDSRSASDAASPKPRAPPASWQGGGPPVVKKPFFPSTQREHMMLEFFSPAQVQDMLALTRFKDDDEGNGWKSYGKGKDVTVQRKSTWGTSCLLIRGQGVIHAPLPCVIRCLMDFSVRLKWDPNMAEAEIKSHVGPGPSDIVMYSRFITGVPGIADRDFIQLRTVQRLEDEQGPLIFVGFKSFEHGDFPARKGVVRAHTFRTGWVCRPTRNAETGAVETTVCMFGQSDLKGWIPTSLINSGLGAAVTKWFKSVNKVCSAEAEKNLAEDAEENLARWYQPA